MIEILRHAAELPSLSEPLREDGDAEPGDVVEDRSAVSPFEAVAGPGAHPPGRGAGHVQVAPPLN